MTTDHIGTAPSTDRSARTSTDAAAETELTVRSVQPDNDQAIRDLMGAALGGGPTGENTAEFFAWKHRLNPFGSSPGLVACSGERIVGVRLFMRWRLDACGSTFRAVRAVDTATSPDFQGRGIFRRLTLSLLEQLDAEGSVDLVFNTPNGSSRPGYLKMGWGEVGLLSFAVTPVRPLRLVRGASAAVATSASSAQPTDHAAAQSGPQAPIPSTASPFEPAGRVLVEAESDIRDLLAQGRRLTGLHTPRTFEYLLWRYGQAPSLDYRAIVTESGGRVTGVAFGRMRARGPLAEFTVSDVVAAAHDVRSCRRLLRASRRSGADHVTLRAAPGTVEADAQLSSGFLRVPHHGLGLVANRRRLMPLDVFDPHSWQLSLGDLEVF